MLKKMCLKIQLPSYVKNRGSSCVQYSMFHITINTEEWLVLKKPQNGCKLTNEACASGPDMSEL